MRNFISPPHIQIETAGGACTARWPMCAVDTWKRPKGVMSFGKFKLLIEKLKHIKNQRFLALHGLGEPLPDKELPEKTAYAKLQECKGIGFASKCTELDAEMAGRLLDAGRDTLMCSIPSSRADKSHITRQS